MGREKLFALRWSNGPRATCRAASQDGGYSAAAHLFGAGSGLGKGGAA